MQKFGIYQLRFNYDIKAIRNDEFSEPYHSVLLNDKLNDVFPISYFLSYFPYDMSDILHQVIFLD